MRAVDGLGNTGEYVTSPGLAVAPPGAAPLPRTTPSSPRMPAPRAAQLRVASARFDVHGTVIRVSGTARRDATGAVQAHVLLRRHGRAVTLTRLAHLRDGRWAIRIRLPRPMRAARVATVTIRYAGDAGTAPAAARVRVRR